MVGFRGYLIFFFILALGLQAQDTLYVKDRRILAAHVTKVNFKAIKYSNESNSTKSKLRARRVVFIHDKNMEHQIINRRIKCRFNFNLYLLCNKTFSNWYSYSDHSLTGLSTVDGVSYSPVEGARKNSQGLNAGANVLIGRRKNINLFLSPNFSLSKSRYIRNTYTTSGQYWGPYLPPYQLRCDTTSSTYIFFNLYIGLHLKLFHRLTLEFGAGWNCPIWARNVVNSSVYNVDNGVYTLTETYENQIDHNTEIYSQWGSFINLGYDFKCFGNVYGLFFSCDFNLANNNVNHTNWLMAGIRFYPFKKHDNRIESE